MVESNLSVVRKIEILACICLAKILTVIKIIKILSTQSPDQSSSRTICSFFSGCGGLDLGLHWAGFELAFANEIDKNAAATFEHNLGKDVCRTSISELHADKVPDADLFVGGFPVSHSAILV